MNPLYFAILVFSLGAFVHVALRLRGGNLRRGAGDRAPLGLGALLGITAGAIYMTGYMLKWGLGGFVPSYRWENRGLYDLEDYLQWTDLFMTEYFTYAYQVNYTARVHFDNWPLAPDQVLNVAIGLAVFWGMVTVWRIFRYAPRLGFIQDIGVGFFAVLGVMPLGAVLFGVGYALFLLLCLALLGVWGKGARSLLPGSRS